MLPKINPNQPIAIDLETCDPELKYTAPGFVSHVGYVAGIAIKASEGAWYIPIRHKEGFNYDTDEVVKWLNETLSADTEKIFHNASYDVGWLTAMGVQMHGTIFDTMLAAALLNENRFNYQLDSLGKIYCNEGKFEEGLKTAVAAKFGGVRTRKVAIRLKEDTPISDYQPFIDAKTRISQHYDLWEPDVKARYDVISIMTDKAGHEDFLVPHRREADVKGLLWAVDPEEMGTYPIQDVELTYKLYEIFKKKLKEESLEALMQMECELILPLLEMRFAGVRIDMKKAVELDKKYTAEIERLQQWIDSKCLFQVNVNVDSDLIAVCKKFNLEYTTTEKGNPSFTKETAPKHEVFDAVLAIRNMFKARDTYIRGYIFGMTLDGWLHGQYNQLKSDEGGTVTGRLSSSNPNMQNLPNPKGSEVGKEIRGLFLPDNADEKWLSMDYSGQEPKMLVHTVLLIERLRQKVARIPQDEIVPGALLAKTEEFRGRSADFHTAVATICMKQEMEMLGKEYTEEELKAAAKKFRPKAKSIGLGVMYGSGNQKVAEEMTKKGFPMTREDAAMIRENIYQGVPFLSFISNYMMNKAQTRGYIKTILGRRGRFDLWECPCFDRKDAKAIGTANFGFKTSAEAWEWYNQNCSEYKIGRPQRAATYKALNKYIQGSSADQTKKAMLDLYKRNNLELNALDIFYRRIPNFEPPKFKTQVHDELNISMTKEERAEWYQEIMENCLPLEVEAVADPVVCDNWAEAK